MLTLTVAFKRLLSNTSTSGHDFCRHVNKSTTMEYRRDGLRVTTIAMFMYNHQYGS